MSIIPTGMTPIITPSAPAAAPLATTRLARVLRRYCSVGECDALAGQMGVGWLSGREQAELAAWRDERRRRVWLLARLIGKRLINEMLSLSPAGLSTGCERMEILSRDAAGRMNRPRIWRDGMEQPWSMSISHSHRGAVVALTTDARTSLGVDLADCNAFSDGFVDLWFTPAERTWFRETQCPDIACFIWAAKESLYKACNAGERFAPRDIEILPNGKYTYRNVTLTDCRLQSYTIDGQLAVLATVTRGRDLEDPLRFANIR